MSNLKLERYPKEKPKGRKVVYMGLTFYVPTTANWIWTNRCGEVRTSSVKPYIDIKPFFELPKDYLGGTAKIDQVMIKEGDWKKSLRKIKKDSK